jgi:excisionase family DNA binding protein
MSYYSITAAARELKVQRKTLYKWIRSGYVPTPKTGAVAGSRREFWTEAEMNKVRDYKKKHYWNRGKKRTIARNLRKTI